jgi:branched-chain amino acid transport system ATP-binding protein
LENHLLEVKGLDVFYGDVQVLYDISLHVDAGVIVSLVGANGAGKSTLLRTISGLEDADKGEVLLSGSSIISLKAQDIVDRGISHVPEGRRLFANLTVLENLKLGAYLPQARSRFSDSLKRTLDLFPILQERKNQKAGSLSGGEQQMLAIGRAVMSNPSILMLDEPSMGLSPIMVKTMFELVTTLNAQGVAMLLVEQNIYQALKIAHYAYVMKTGRIVLTGKGEDLLANPEVQDAYLGERRRMT